MHKKDGSSFKIQALASLERKATDRSGHLGSFYDGYADCIVGQINMDEKGRVEQMEDPVKCKITYGDRDKTQNLLQIAGIEDDLRLSILLKLAPRTRIASIANHPYPINEYTRSIHYYYEHRKECLPEDVAGVRRSIGPSQPQTTATHIITSITYGIEAVIVLQLSSNNMNINQIDDALRRVQHLLTGNLDTPVLISKDENLLRHSTKILVYSNVFYLNGMTSMRDICRFINNRNKNENLFRPLTYTLKPIQLVYPQFIGSDSKFIHLESTYHNKLEQYLVWSLNILKNLKYSLDCKVVRLLCGHLGERVSKLQQQWVNLTNMREDHIKSLRKLVINIRHDRREMFEIDKAVNNNKQAIFYDETDRMTQALRDLEEKGHLITDLTNEHFQYCNVVDYEIDQNDNETTIERKLLSNKENVQVLCSNDTLNKNEPKQLRKLCKHLIKKREKYPELRLIYADFAYSFFKLNDILMIPSRTHKKDKNKPKQTDTSSSKELPMTPLNTNVINILLLGETGVGKSTFINALANYLTFETLQEAEASQPVVLIPVSFLITVGDNFEEHEVKFGDVDDSKNEDFEHSGQSVTQRCRSYVFNIDHNGRKKLCIIDTPGFGDTRGLQQDDFNMTHILEYIQNLSHLNAICFLLKPNESRLNIFFRSCLDQLFSLLGSNIAQNILFCFTNSRSTFYAPGNTAPLLKKMLTSLSKVDVPFKKDNTFCFDNESFRYLVALRNPIPFSDCDKQEYEKSWSTSVIESDGLIDCILTKLTAYRVDGNLYSIKHAQLEILHMIRPILETMRTILRNRIIHTIDHSDEIFELHPKVISRSASICTLCTPYPLQVGNFWVAYNIPHEVRGTCRSCRCSLDHHHPLDYVLDYECSKQSSKYDHHAMDNLLHDLCQACVNFADFLTNIGGVLKNEPFFTGLVQMITEEKYLADNQKPNHLNLQLVDDLTELQKDYDKRMNYIVCNQKKNKLADIYQLINTVHKYPMVREQMSAVKERQRMMMKQYQCEVQTNPINGLITNGGSF